MQPMQKEPPRGGSFCQFLFLTCMDSALCASQEKNPTSSGRRNYVAANAFANEERLLFSICKFCRGSNNFRKLFILGKEKAALRRRNFLENISGQV